MRNFQVSAYQGFALKICLDQGDAYGFGQPKSSESFANVSVGFMDRIENGFNPAGEPPE